jgi:hypothetical protein
LRPLRNLLFFLAMRLFYSIFGFSTGG